MSGETFGQMLRRLRIERGLSQNELARRAGCDAAYVNRFERVGPGAMVGRAIVLSVADALEMSYAERDRLLFVAGLAPCEDWQTRAEDAEVKLDVIREAIGVLTTTVEPIDFVRRTG